MGIPESGRCRRRDDRGSMGMREWWGVGSGMKRAEVGQLMGKCERERRGSGRENGMATGDGGSRERTERPEQ